MFKLKSNYQLQGDQPAAVREMLENLNKGLQEQVLLGVTGSGKTFSIANVIAQSNRPALIMAPNKTLAAQLFSEFKELFPENAVEYFVSYYDYYQPEAYVPTTDVYIEKDAAINEKLEQMRHSATRSLLTRRDVIVVSSISCIYGLGSPGDYSGMKISLQPGQKLDRTKLLMELAQIQYERDDFALRRSTFRVRGEVIDIIPAYEEKFAVRVTLLGDEIETLQRIEAISGEVKETLSCVDIFPSSHYVTPKERLDQAVETIEKELEARLLELRASNKLLEAQRLEQRTRYDLELLRETGICSGIENYSRHLDGRNAGDPCSTLFSYLPEGMLLFIDESHITVPQAEGMYKGDRSRKQTLVDYGFRLPSALDNRPLRFDEFERRRPTTIYVSATPGDYELKRTQGYFVEQVIRPTGLVDPEIEMLPARDQVKQVMNHIPAVLERKERVLITTLTKRMAEDLTDFFKEHGVNVRYLHSDIHTIERSDIIRDFRRGVFDVLIGINLLREGLDLPEVSLVAIMDADKEGFLRSARSLIQTCGRAARNVNGKVLFFADKETNSIMKAKEETQRRRKKQLQYNKEHNIFPETIKKNIQEVLSSIYERDYVQLEVSALPQESKKKKPIPLENLPKKIETLRKEMVKAAKALDFELAAELRDEIFALEKLIMEAI